MVGQSSHRMIVRFKGLIACKVPGFILGTKDAMRAEGSAMAQAQGDSGSSLGSTHGPSAAMSSCASSGPQVPGS